MPNIGAIVAWGIYRDFGAMFVGLVLAGSVLGVFGGFAHFSKGALFSRGKGEVFGTLAICVAVGIGVYIGFAFGFWMGLLSCVLFWPTMYRLGVKILLAISAPK